MLHNNNFKNTKYHPQNLLKKSVHSSQDRDHEDVNLRNLEYM